MATTKNPEQQGSAPVPANPAGKGGTMPDIDNFSLRDMVEFSAALRQMGTGAGSMQEVAGSIVQYLYENLTDKKNGEKTCVLVRLFRTLPWGELDPGQQAFARNLLAGP